MIGMLRGIVIAQVAMLALAGAMCRNAFTIPGIGSLSVPTYEAIAGTLLLVGLGSALLVLILAWNLRLTSGKKWGITGVEVAMVLANFAAALPLVQ